MYHPSGYLDSSNIVIYNKNAYYYIIGTSYKDKLKNSLSLEYVFRQEDNDSYITDDPIIEIISKDIPNKRLSNKFDYYEFNDYNYSKRKKKINKKFNMRNLKKNKIRQNGYSDKIFNITQNLPELYDEEHRIYYINEEDDDDGTSEYYDNYSYNYHNIHHHYTAYNYSDNYSDIDSDLSSDLSSDL